MNRRDLLNSLKASQQKSLKENRGLINEIADMPGLGNRLVSARSNALARDVQSEKDAELLANVRARRAELGMDKIPYEEPTPTGQVSPTVRSEVASTSDDLDTGVDNLIKQYEAGNISKDELKDYTKQLTARAAAKVTEKNKQEMEKTIEDAADTAADIAGMVPGPIGAAIDAAHAGTYVARAKMEDDPQKAAEYMQKAKDTALYGIAAPAIVGIAGKVGTKGVEKLAGKEKVEKWTKALFGKDVAGQIAGQIGGGASSYLGAREFGLGIPASLGVGLAGGLLGRAVGGKLADKFPSLTKGSQLGQEGKLFKEKLGKFVSPDIEPSAPKTAEAPRAVTVEVKPKAISPLKKAAQVGATVAALAGGPTQQTTMFIKPPEAAVAKVDAPVGAKTVETKAPETKAPETKAPETKAPETKAPETTTQKGKKGKQDIQSTIRDIIAQKMQLPVVPPTSGQVITTPPTPRPPKTTPPVPTEETPEDRLPERERSKYGIRLGRVGEFGGAGVGRYTTSRTAYTEPMSPEQEEELMARRFRRASIIKGPTEHITEQSGIANVIPDKMIADIIDRMTQMKRQQEHEYADAELVARKEQEFEVDKPIEPTKSGKYDIENYLHKIRALRGKFSPHHFWQMPTETSIALGFPAETKGRMPYGYRAL